MGTPTSRRRRAPSVAATAGGKAVAGRGASRSSPKTRECAAGDAEKHGRNSELGGGAGAVGLSVTDA
ncbi:hypothetical protein ACFWMX_13755 [Streptomyces sp. NPDC058378]|uniref:hypothetical protein n=1 Tax=Streptomyces sp. NPDC058378 TaxID=3346469 RepID=UPI003663DD86